MSYHQKANFFIGGISEVRLYIHEGWTTDLAFLSSLLIRSSQQVFKTNLCIESLQQVFVTSLCDKSL